MKKVSKTQVLILIIILILIGAGWGGYEFYKTKELLKLTEGDLASTTVALEGKTAEGVALSEALYSEQQKNAYFESQIKEIAGTVGVLDKLSKTDKELLQKYSKVYFLNEHYEPQSLSEIPSDLTYENGGRKYKIHSQVLPQLEEMIKDAEDASTPIRVISAYRSYDEQLALKGNYTFTYGSGANTFSADQGYSEHQLGTTIDLTTVKLGPSFTQFGDTEAYKWLLENAYKYGFILSYPEDNAYYQFEPWHWRFVGKRLAERLHEEGENFYDLDQRKIDAYLVNIFD